MEEWRVSIHGHEESTLSSTKHLDCAASSRGHTLPARRRTKSTVSCLIASASALGVQRTLCRFSHRRGSKIAMMIQWQLQRSSDLACARTLGRQSTVKLQCWAVMRGLGTNQLDAQRAEYGQLEPPTVHSWRPKDCRNTNHSWST